MLKLKKGIDILSEIGDIKTEEAANTLLKRKCNQKELRKLRSITNVEARCKIANAIALYEPDSIFINSGSDEDLEYIRNSSINAGEEKPLALENHTVHFDLPEEQARIVDRTYYIVSEGEDVSSLAKKTRRKDAYEYISSHMKGIAWGKNLYIGFFIRGPIGAKASIPALEITTSAYVMHSADLLYRNGYAKFDEEVERAGVFFTNLHSQGENRSEDLPNARVFMDRSWLTTYSMFCTYAGNTLLLKKGNHRFAVDLATYRKTGEELSEHMFITGLNCKDDTRIFFAGAAPSGCGKTTTAMVGDEFIGDDLAQLWIADDGTLRGINPEKGVFSIVKDVNDTDDPHLMEVLRNEGTEVIFSNVLIDKNNVPHWVGHGEEMPDRGINFQGEWWTGKTGKNGNPIPPSHPNARCTLESTAIENYNDSLAEDARGVEIKVITYSGRDSDTMPPVVVAKTPDHGVVFGASILSAATATEVGVTGVRRQPWANEPFIPGPLGDYMDAQFRFYNSDRLIQKPIMANLNYFLVEKARGGDTNELLGEKQDVKVWLRWLANLAANQVETIETPIGYIPGYEDLKELFNNLNKTYSKEIYEQQFSLYVDNIIDRIDLQEDAYKKGQRIPYRLFEVYEEQKAGLEILRKQYGSVVSVEQVLQFSG